jgi:antitoxin component YwqK of YwqJK toxin-antitoxin module
MKPALNMIVLAFTFLFMSIVNGQEDFDPNKLEEKFFQNEKIVNESTFTDKLGNSYKIINTEYSKGVCIKKDGNWLKHGVFFSFSGGRKTNKTTYSYGKKHGEWENYYDGIKLQFKCTYQNDLKEGTWYQYREDGAKWREKVYKNNLVEGDEFVYYPGGTIYFINKYVNDKKHGESIQYKENGDVFSKTQYNMGVKVEDK